MKTSIKLVYVQKLHAIKIFMVHIVFILIVVKRFGNDLVCTISTHLNIFSTFHFLNPSKPVAVIGLLITQVMPI